MARVLDAVRAYFADTFEESGYYIYNVTKDKIAFAKTGNKFCDHWENLDETDADLAKFVRDAFKAEQPKKVFTPVLKAAEPKSEKPKKAAEPKKAKEKPDMTGAKQVGTRWLVTNKWAQSKNGKFWKVTKVTKAGWEVESHSGCKGRILPNGDWVAA